MIGRKEDNMNNMQVTNFFTIEYGINFNNMATEPLRFIN